MHTVTGTLKIDYLELSEFELLRFHNLTIIRIRHKDPTKMELNVVVIASKEVCNLSGQIARQHSPTYVQLHVMFYGGWTR